jgi:hypothetical protein
MGTVPGFRTSRTEPEGNPWSGPTIGISAPFKIKIGARKQLHGEPRQLPANVYESGSWTTSKERSFQ